VIVVEQPSASATTDTQGQYSIHGVQASFYQLSPLLSASSPGHFTAIEFADAAYQPIAGDRRLDFALDPVLRITLGEVAHGQLNVGDRVCSHWGYGASPCARFAIAVPSSGLLDVTLSGLEADFDFDVVGPDGDFALYGTASSHFNIAVVAESTYELRIIGWGTPRDFELTTALR
jgi:hypothetical protein